MGYFACRVCYRRAGMDIPAHADRVKVRNARKAARLERKAEREAAAARKAAESAAVAIAENVNVAMDIDVLMAELRAMLTAEVNVNA